MSYDIKYQDIKVTALKNNGAIHPKTPLDWAIYRVAIMLCEMGDLVLKDKQVKGINYNPVPGSYRFSMVFHTKAAQTAFWEKLKTIETSALIDNSMQDFQISHQDNEIEFTGNNLFHFPSLVANICCFFGNSIKTRQPIDKMGDIDAEILSSMNASYSYSSEKAVISAANDFLDSANFGKYDGFSVKPYDVSRLIWGHCRSKDKSILAIAAAQFH